MNALLVWGTQVSALTGQQLWELPRSLTRLSIGHQNTKALCAQLKILAEMAEEGFTCVRHLYIGDLRYEAERGGSHVTCPSFAPTYPSALVPT